MSAADLTPRCSRFEGRRAVVTGGAGNIGRAIVRRLRDEGAEVAMVDHDGDLLAEAADQLGPAGGVHVFAADVTVDVESTLDAITAHLGAWDVLVGAVGVIPKRSWRETDEATWARTIDVNLTSAFRWSAAACRRWIDAPVEDHTPAIVHVVSVEATVAFPQQVAYAASKAGLAGLIRAMAVDLADAGVRICGVAPGTVPNDRTGAARDWESHTARIPLRRLGRPADVAAAVAYLASEDAAYVTGEILYVDGGFVVA